VVAVHRRDQRLINPANKREVHRHRRRHRAGRGVRRGQLAELGYKVLCFCFQDSPRRAHSIAAQGGINAAKNYRNDGDSVYRLFYDTIKGGDFRARGERLPARRGVVNIIDQCVAQGVPFAREYGGLLDTRSFGGAQAPAHLLLPRADRPATAARGVPGALPADRLGTVKMFPRCEMLDLVVIDGRARGIVTRHLETGKIESFTGDAVVLATGGYSNVFFLSTNARLQRHGDLPGLQARRRLRQPVLHADPPDVHPRRGDHQSKLTLMSESLRNDGRVWVPKDRADVGKHPNDIPEAARDYYLERKYPSFGNLAPRDIASRAAKEACDDGRGVGPGGRGVYLDFADAIRRQGKDRIEEKYGNLFDMYERITAENAYTRPMRIYPALHYTMGGLWVTTS
jgi:succinate dehydrogenase / fumarate reductase, flavoprotein subunit